MSTHPNIRQIRSRLYQHRNHHPVEMYRGQEAHSLHHQRPMMTTTDDLHPLTGLRSAYYICMTERIEDITSLIRRWLIRLVYFKWEWYSGARVHDMGIFTDRDVAEEIAAQKRTETGKAWSVKELPVNGLLPDAAVQYGFYSFPGAKADLKYQNRPRKFAAIPQNDLEQLADLESKMGSLADCIEGECGKAT